MNKQTHVHSLVRELDELCSRSAFSYAFSPKQLSEISLGNISNCLVQNEVQVKKNSEGGGGTQRTNMTVSPDVRDSTFVKSQVDAVAKWLESLSAQASIDSQIGRASQVGVKRDHDAIKVDRILLDPVLKHLGQHGQIVLKTALTNSPFFKPVRRKSRRRRRSSNSKATDEEEQELSIQNAIELARERFRKSICQLLDLSISEKSLVGLLIAIKVLVCVLLEAGPPSGDSSEQRQYMDITRTIIDGPMKSLAECKSPTFRTLMENFQFAVRIKLLRQLGVPANALKQHMRNQRVEAMGGTDVTRAPALEYGLQSSDGVGVGICRLHGDVDVDLRSGKIRHENVLGGLFASRAQGVYDKVHRGVRCDGCNTANYLRGPRFKCAVCPDTDLCLDCFVNAKHEMHHEFDIMVTPSDTKERLPARNSKSSCAVIATGVNAFEHLGENELYYFEVTVTAPFGDLFVGWTTSPRASSQTSISSSSDGKAGDLSDMGQKSEQTGNGDRKPELSGSIEDAGAVDVPKTQKSSSRSAGDLSDLQQYCQNPSECIPGFSGNTCTRAIVFNAKQSTVHDCGERVEVALSPLSRSEPDDEDSSSTNDVSSPHPAKGPDDGENQKSSFADDQHNLAEGDVIGCWYNPRTGQVGFSLNSQQVQRDFHLHPSPDRVAPSPGHALYPVIAFQSQWVQDDGDARFPARVSNQRILHRQRFESNTSSQSSESSESSDQHTLTFDTKHARHLLSSDHAASEGQMGPCVTLNVGHRPFVHEPPRARPVATSSRPYCLRLAGQGCLETRAPESVQFSSGFTVEALVRWEPCRYVLDRSAFQPLAVFYRETDGKTSAEGRFSKCVALGVVGGGQLSMRTFRSSGQVVADVLTEEVVLSPGEWQHVAVTGTQFKTKFYVNGVAVGTVHLSSLQALAQCSLSGMVSLGGFLESWRPNDSVPAGFQGGLSSVRLSKRSMSSSRLARCAGRCISEEEDADLVGFFSLDEGGGAVAHERAGEMHHAILRGDAFFQSVDVSQALAPSFNGEGKSDKRDGDGESTKKENNELGGQKQEEPAKKQVNQLNGQQEQEEPAKKHVNQLNGQQERELTKKQINETWEEFHATNVAKELGSCEPISSVEGNRSAVQTRVNKETFGNKETISQEKGLSRILVLLFAHVVRISEGYTECVTTQQGLGTHIHPPTIAVAPNALSFLLMHSILRQLFNHLSHETKNNPENDPKSLKLALKFALEVLRSNLVGLSELCIPATSIGLGASPGGANTPQVYNMRSLLTSIAIHFLESTQNLDQAVAQAALSVLGVGVEIFFPSTKERQVLIWSLLKFQKEGSPSIAMPEDCTEQHDLSTETFPVKKLKHHGKIMLLEALCKRMVFEPEEFMSLLNSAAGNSIAADAGNSLKWPSHHVLNSLRGKADNILAAAAATANSGGSGLTKREVIRYMREVAPSSWLKENQLKGHETTLVKLLTNDTIAQLYMRLEREFVSLQKLDGKLSTSQDKGNKDSSCSEWFSLVKLVARFVGFLLKHMRSVSSGRKFDLTLGTQCAAILFQLAREELMAPLRVQRRCSSAFVRAIRAPWERYLGALQGESAPQRSDREALETGPPFWQLHSTNTAGLEWNRSSALPSADTRILKFDRSKSPSSVRVSGDGRTCTQQVSKKWRTLVASTGIRRNTGVHRWRVTVNQVNHRGHMFLGLASSRLNGESFLGRDDHGFGVLLSGDVYHRGSPIKVHVFQRGILKKGSQVELELNSDRGTLSMTEVNGSKRSLGVVLDTSIAQRNIFEVPGGELFPAACMYEEADSVTLSGFVQESENGPMLSLDQDMGPDDDGASTVTASVATSFSVDEETNRRKARVQVDANATLTMSGSTSFPALVEQVLRIFSNDCWTQFKGSEQNLVALISGTVMPVVASACLWYEFATEWCVGQVGQVKEVVLEIQSRREELRSKGVHEADACARLHCPLCKSLLELEVLFGFLHGRLCAHLIASNPQVNSEGLILSRYPRSKTVVEEEGTQRERANTTTGSNFTENNLMWCTKGLLAHGLRTSTDHKHPTTVNRKQPTGVAGNSVKGNGHVAPGKDLKAVALLNQFLDHSPEFMLLHLWVLRHLSFQPAAIMHLGGKRLEKATLAVVVIMLWHTQSLDLAKEVGSVLLHATKGNWDESTDSGTRHQALIDLVDKHPQVRPPFLFNEVWKVAMQVKSWLIRYANISESSNEEVANLLLQHVWFLIELAPCAGEPGEAGMSPEESRTFISQVTRAFIGTDEYAAPPAPEEPLGKMQPPSLSRSGSAPIVPRRLQDPNASKSQFGTAQGLLKPLPLARSWSLRSQRSVNSGSSVNSGPQKRSRWSLAFKKLAQQVTLFLSDATSGRIDPRVIHAMMLARSQCARTRELGFHAASSFLNSLPLSAQLVPVHAAFLLPVIHALRGEKNCFSSTYAAECGPPSPTPGDRARAGSSLCPENQRHGTWHYTDELDSCGESRLRVALPAAFSKLAMAMIRAMRAFSSAGGPQAIGLQLNIIRAFGVRIRTVDLEMVSSTSLFSVLHRMLVHCRQGIHAVVAEEEVMVAKDDESDDSSPMGESKDALKRTRLELKLVSRATMKLVFLLCSQVTESTSDDLQGFDLQKSSSLVRRMSEVRTSSNISRGPETLSGAVFEMLFEEMSVAADDVFSAVDFPDETLGEGRRSVTETQGSLAMDPIVHEALHQLHEIGSLLLSVSIYSHCAQLMWSENWMSLLLSLLKRAPRAIMKMASDLLCRILPHCPTDKFQVEETTFDSLDVLNPTFGDLKSHNEKLVAWLLHQVSLPYHNILVDDDSVVGSGPTMNPSSMAAQMLSYECLKILRTLAKYDGWKSVIFKLLNKILQLVPESVEQLSAAKGNQVSNTVQLLGSLVVLGGELVGLMEGTTVKLNRGDLSPCVHAELNISEDPSSQHDKTAEKVKLEATLSHTCARSATNVESKLNLRQCEVTPVVPVSLAEEFIPDETVQMVIRACKQLCVDLPLEELPNDQTLFFQVTYSKGVVMMRSAPSTEASEVGSKSHGTVVRASAVHGKWIKLVGMEAGDIKPGSEVWMLAVDDSGERLLTPCDANGCHLEQNWEGGDAQSKVVEPPQENSTPVLESEQPRRLSTAARAKFVMQCTQSCAFKSLTNVQTHPAISLLIRNLFSNRLTSESRSQVDTFRALMPVCFRRARVITGTYGVMDLPALEERLYILSDIIRRPIGPQKVADEEDNAAAEEGLSKSEVSSDRRMSVGAESSRSQDMSVESSVADPQLQAIMEMGFPPHWARIAFAETGDAEAAINWIISNGDLLGGNSEENQWEEHVEDVEVAHYYRLGGTASENGTTGDFEDENEDEEEVDSQKSGTESTVHGSGDGKETASVPEKFSERVEFFESNMGYDMIQLPGMAGCTKESHSGWVDNGYGGSLNFLEFSNSVLHTDTSAKERAAVSSCDLAANDLMLSANNEQSLQNRENRIWFPVSNSRPGYVSHLRQSSVEVVVEEAALVAGTIATLRCRMFVLYLWTQVCRYQESAGDEEHRTAWECFAQALSKDSGLDDVKMTEDVIWLIQVMCFKLFPFYSEMQLQDFCRMLTRGFQNIDNEKEQFSIPSSKLQVLSLPICIMDTLEMMISQSPHFTRCLVAKSCQHIEKMATTEHATNVLKTGALVRSYDRSMDSGPCLWFVQWTVFLLLKQEIVQRDPLTTNGVQHCITLWHSVLKLMNSPHLGIKYQGVRLINMFIRVCQQQFVDLEKSSTNPQVLHFARAIVGGLDVNRLESAAALHLYMEGDQAPWFSSFLQHLVDTCAALKTCKGLLQSCTKEVTAEEGERVVKLHEKKGWLTLMHPRTVGEAKSAGSSDSESEAAESTSPSSLAPPWTVSFRIRSDAVSSVPDASRALVYSNPSWTSCVGLYLHTQSSNGGSEKSVDESKKPSEPETVVADDVAESKPETTSGENRGESEKSSCEQKNERQVNDQERCKESELTTKKTNGVGFRYNDQHMVFPYTIPEDEWVELSFVCGTREPEEVVQGGPYFISLVVDGKYIESVPVGGGQSAFLPIHSIGSPTTTLGASIAGVTCWDCSLSNLALETIATLRPSKSKKIFPGHQVFSLDFSKVQSQSDADWWKEMSETPPMISRSFIPSCAPHPGVLGALVSGSARVCSSRSSLPDPPPARENLASLLSKYPEFGDDGMHPRLQQEYSAERGLKRRLKFGIRAPGMMTHDPNALLPKLRRERVLGEWSMETQQAVTLFLWCPGETGGSHAGTQPLDTEPGPSSDARGGQGSNGSKVEVIGVLEWNPSDGAGAALVTGKLNTRNGRCVLRLDGRLFGDFASTKLAESLVLAGRYSAEKGLVGEWKALAQVEVLRNLCPFEMRFLPRKDGGAAAVKYLHGAMAVTSGGPSSQHSTVVAEVGAAEANSEESAEEAVLTDHEDDLDGNTSSGSDSEGSMSEMSVHENNSTWDCVVCTFINDGEVSSCAMCGTANPEPAAGGSGQQDSSACFEGPGGIQVGSGTWYWDLKIHRGTSTSAGVSVGVCEAGANLDGRLGSDGHGWALQSHNGNTRHRDVSRGYAGSGLVDGDIVTVELDTDERTLTFFVNGKSKGIAFRGSDGLLDSPVSPCACVYRSGETVHLLGLKSGQGKLEYHSLHPKKFVSYQGEWKHGKREGYGKLTKQDGTVSHGLWKNDERDGIHAVYRPLPKTPSAGKKKEKKVNGSECESTDSSSSDSDSDVVKERSESEASVSSKESSEAALDQETSDEPREPNTKLMYVRFQSGDFKAKVSREEYVAQQQEHNLEVLPPNLGPGSGAPDVPASAPSPPQQPLPAIADQHTEPLRCAGSLETSSQSLFVLDPSTAGPGLEVSDHGLTLQLAKKTGSLGSSSRCHVLGNRGFSSGVHYWEVKVLGMERGSTYIGIAEASKLGTSRHRLESLSQFPPRGLLHRQTSATGRVRRVGEGWGGGYGFVNYRATHSPRGEQLYGTFYGAGDTVGVLLDMDRGQLSFVKRGKDFSNKEVVLDLGMAYSGLREGRNPVGGGAGRQEAGSGLWGTTFYPCIGFSRKGDKVTLKDTRYFSFHRPTARGWLREATLAAHALSVWAAHGRGVSNVEGAQQGVQPGSASPAVSRELLRKAHGLYVQGVEGHVAPVRAMGGEWIAVDKRMGHVLPVGLQQAKSFTRLQTERGFATLFGVHRDCVWYQVEGESSPSYWHVKELRALVKKQLVSIAGDEPNSKKSQVTQVASETTPLTLEEFEQSILNPPKKWTVRHDLELVSMVNRKCDERGCHPVQLPFEVLSAATNGSSGERSDQLNWFSTQQLQVRFSVLLALNMWLSRSAALMDLRCSTVGRTQVARAQPAPATAIGACHAVERVRAPRLHEHFRNAGETLTLHRGLLFTRTKLGLWSDWVKSSETYTNLTPDEYDVPPDIPQIQVNRIRASQHRLLGLPFRDRLARSVFGQLLLDVKLGQWDSVRLRRSYVHPQDAGQERCFFVKFESEGVDDHGGPYRALFQIAAEEEPAGALGMLLPCPNAEEGGMVNRDKMVFSWFASDQRAEVQERAADASPPDSPDDRERHVPGDLDTCELLGKLVGIANRHGMMVGLNLPDLVWKPLVGLPVGVKELHDVDSFTANSIRQFDMMNREQWDSARAEWSALLWDKLDQGTARCEQHVRGACQAEARPEIPFELRTEVTGRVLEMYLESASEQLQAFAEGMSMVLPTVAFHLFTSTELEALVCAKPEIDVELLKQVTEYENIKPDSKPVEYFWEALESMTQEERAKFINFVCARSRLPNSADKFPMNFKIQGGSTDGLADEAMPHSQTCFFSLTLPAYSSATICKEKLLYASENCNTMEDFDAHEASGFEQLE